MYECAGIYMSFVTPREDQASGHICVCIRICMYGYEYEDQASGHICVCIRICMYGYEYVCICMNVQVCAYPL